MNFQTVAFEAAAGRADQLPRSDLPEVVFSGKSNVGKSSLLNKLVNRKAIARVSATPGEDRHHQLLPAGGLPPGGPAGLRLREGLPKGEGALGQAGGGVLRPSSGRSPW